MTGKPALVQYGARRTPWGRIWVARGEDGVLAVALGPDPVGKLSEDVRARRQCRLVHDPAAVGGLLDDLAGYLAGERPNLARWRIDPTGLSEFRRKVYEAARAVPYGRLVAYKDVAGQVATPRHAHAVRTALAQNPFRLLVPDHRVTLARGGTGAARRGGGWRTRLMALESGQTAIEWNGARA